MNPLFATYSHADVQRLVKDYPLAWVISPGAPAASAVLLPMLGRYDAQGALVGLIGHMSRRNPLCARFELDSRAQFLFTGPQAYVSPQHAGRRNWGPTWNYAALRIEAQVRLDDTLTEPSLDLLTSASEAGRPQPWTAAELGPRYHGMVEAIIGFEARVTGFDATFKLAQDEDDEVLAHLLQAHPDAPLRDWMHRMNAERLG